MYSSELPKKGEGEEHIHAKIVTANIIKNLFGYKFRLEYPIKLKDKGQFSTDQHTFDIVFWKPNTMFEGLSGPMYVTDAMENFDNRALLYLSIKPNLDKTIELVGEIDDYEKHTHKEQVLNDREAENMGRQVFAPNVKFIRPKKEDIVAYKKMLAPTDDCESIIKQLCFEAGIK